LIEKHIHIVAFDVPYPADYGGVIDIYYRIKALYELGFKITLHCFDYGRGEQTHLSEITEKVYYYSRSKTIWNGLNKRPFIVASRRSKALLNRLLEDEFPILFEGIHTSWFLENADIQKRKTVVRTHNIEQDYYISLSKNVGFLKSLYFKLEALKLKRYESILEKASKVLCIKESDAQHIRQFNKNTFVLPASLPEINVNEYVHTERYALFNGNLSVPENEIAAIWIIEKIWSKNPFLLPLKIAGKNPSEKLIKLVKQHNVELVSNPKKEDMDSLILKARIHILVTDQVTGVKLKLLTALQNSGHVLVNNNMIDGTNLGEFCTICTSAAEFKKEIIYLSENELDGNKFLIRSNYIIENYSTKQNCFSLFE
jgi:hypothetical protein